MLRQVLSNNRADRHKAIGLLAFILIAGCTYVQEAGMTEWDYKLKQEGYILHCSEMIDSDCITHDWFNQTMNTYKRFHNGPSINGTNSSDN